MSGRQTGVDTTTARLRATEEALQRVQAQTAALEELGEQLSLSVHVLEAEVAALAAEVRSRPVAADGAAAGAASGETPEAPRRAPERSSDVDGARLVALDMALAGQPREATERYLDEHYEIDDRERLLDDVYEAAGAR